MNPTLPTYSSIFYKDRSNAQRLIFVLNSLREAEFFVEFVEGLTIWEQGKRDSLDRDKEYDIVFILM